MTSMGKDAKWVVQEVVLSQSADVLFHDCRISWRWVGNAAAILRTEYDGLMKQHNASGIYNAYLMFRLADSDDLGRVHLSSLELLRLTANFRTSEEKDSVFSLLGLETKDHHPETKPLIHVDCSQDLPPIYYRVAKRLILGDTGQEKSLGVLLDSGIKRTRQHYTPNWGGPVTVVPTLSTHAERSQTTVLPSWVPTWDDQEGHQPCLLAPWSLQDSFNASPGLDEGLHSVIIDGPRLRARAVEFSVILSTGSKMIDELALRRNVARLMMSSESWSADTIRPQLALFSRTLCAGRDEHGGRECNPTALIAPFLSLVGSIASRGMDLSWRIAHAWQSLPGPARDAEGDHGSAAREKFSHLAGTMARYRCVCIAANGQLGLGPAAAQKGDVVSLIGGVKLPFVLRPNPEQTSVYEAVGPCYVGDVMNVEVMDAMSEGRPHFGAFWTTKFGEFLEKQGCCETSKLREVVISLRCSQAGKNSYILVHNYSQQAH
jgi:hypothetical protein